MTSPGEGAPPACLLCGAFAEPLWGDEPTVLRCPACEAAFLAEFPPPEENRAGYQEDYYQEETGDRFVGPADRAIEALVWLRWRAIVRRHPASGTLLDVGCGRGDLLELFQRRGWRGIGTQLSETAALAARSRRGVDVRCAELPDLGLPVGSVDVVTFFHVLEHLRDPLAYLLCAREALSDNGLLVVEVPNFGSVGARILKRRDLCFDYPHHLFFFTPGALEALLRRSGFRIEGRTHFCLPYSPYTSLQNLLNLLPGAPNRLYRSLQMNADGRRLLRSPSTWLHILLGTALAAPATLFSLVGLVAPIGNTMRLYCRKQRGE